MKLLVYCLLRASARSPEPVPAGVGGAAVELLQEGPLAAVLSRVEEVSKGPPGLTPILEYRDVVEAFASAATVLPVRYGAFFDREEQLRDFLCRERGRLEQLLGGVQDQVEMTVLVSARMPTAEPPSSAQESAGQVSGRAYLAARRAYYAQRDEGQQNAGRLLERCRTAFAGLFTRSNVEARPFPLAPARSDGAPRQVVSLSFLVPRGRVAEFRERYRAMTADEDAEFTLTGPRPPYSFVSLRPAPEGRSAGLSP